jgi:catechol 2,3-dioxygenase-like lactoylglutathione lyase family enzyme
MSLFKVQHIDHVVLRVKDMEKSLEFYIEVLGCLVKKRNDQYAMIHLAAGSSMIDLVDIDGPLGAMGGGAPGKERRNVDHFAFVSNRSMRRRSSPTVTIMASPLRRQ